jgi:hypothetical protein
MEESPKKSLRRLSQEAGMSKSTCQRSTQRAKIRAYCVTAVHELTEPDREKRAAYCRWLQAFHNEHPGILDFVWFTDEAWFHRQTSSYGAFSNVMCMDIGHEHCRACETTENEIQAITPETLHRVQACLGAQGGHFQHLLWRSCVQHETTCVRY